MSDMIDLQTAQARVAQLEAENARLLEALKPFAAMAPQYAGQEDSHIILSAQIRRFEWIHILVGDLRRAALAGTKSAIDTTGRGPLGLD